MECVDFSRKLRQRDRAIEVDVLGFEFEMGLLPAMGQKAKEKGIDLAIKRIPREALERHFAHKDRIVFCDLSYVTIQLHVRGNEIAIELICFVFGERETNAASEPQKITFGEREIPAPEVASQSAPRHWLDWIDYWSIDFDFGFDENPIFKSQWQSFRTKQKRRLERICPFYEVPLGRRKVVVKVVDILGNETMAAVELTLPQR